MAIILTHYLDTSALMRFLDIAHPSCEPLTTYLRDHGLLRNRSLWSSELTHLEATRVAVREQDEPLQDMVDALFGSVIHGAGIDDDVLARARAIPEHIKSLDALHVATALGAGNQTLITYDVNMARVAKARGLSVVAP